MSSSTIVASSRVPSRSASADLPTPSGPSIARWRNSTGRWSISYQVSTAFTHRAAGAAPAPPAARALLRDQLRPRLRPDVRPGARRRATACRGSASASPTPIRSTAPRRPRPRGTSSRTSSRRSCSGATFAHPREVFPALARGPRPQHGEGRRRDGRVGSVRAAAPGVPLCARCSAARAGGSHPACRSASRIRSTSSRSEVAHRARRRLPAHQDQDQAGLGHRRGRDGPRSGSAAIPLMVDANAAYTLADAAHLAALDAST